MSPEQNNDAEVSASVVQGSQEEHINISAEDAKATAPSDVPTPETFGVTQAQYEKYYNQQTGEYNWQAHAREAEYIAGQRAEQSNTQPEAQAQDTEAFATAEEAVEKAGLDWGDLSYKIGANGDIDAADYAQLMQMGIPRDVVEQHVGMVRQQVEQHVQTVTNAFGGEEQWRQTQAWANSNLTEQEQEQFNQMLAGPNYQMAVDLLMSKAGTQMSNMPMGTGGQQTVQPYASQMEMVADQRKPEYRRDPAFRDMVMRRAAVSDWSHPAHTAR